LDTWSVTQRNHALAIVVQVLHQHLTQRIHLPCILLREVLGQEPTLLLQTPHQIRQLLHHAFVRAEVRIFRQNDTEIEDKLISIIFDAFHADWISHNSIAIAADLEEVSAELLPGNDEGRDVREGEEWGLGSMWGGDNGSLRDLVDYFGP
jgi:hypothetical protein